MKKIILFTLILLCIGFFLIVYIHKYKVNTLINEANGVPKTTTRCILLTEKIKKDEAYGDIINNFTKKTYNNSFVISISALSSNSYDISIIGDGSIYIVVDFNSCDTVLNYLERYGILELFNKHNIHYNTYTFEIKPNLIDVWDLYQQKYGNDNTDQ